MAPPDHLTLDEAAAELGVHYMTAYRYVRSGRLPAVRVGGQWRVAPSDLAQVSVGFESRPGRPVGETKPSPTRARRMAHRLVAGDEPGAWALIEAARAAGSSVEDVYVQLLAPAMRTIGDRWEAGELSVADEHRATAVAHRLIGRLGPEFRRPGRTKGTVVIAAPAPDLHGLPCAMLADLVRAAGFTVVDLGANAPAESVAEAAAAADRLKAVALGVTGLTDRAVRAFIRELHEASIDCPVLLGGAAIEDEEHARRLGADAYTGHDATEAVAAITTL